MKKRYLGIFGLSCAALVLTGCGGSSKKLVCTQNMSDELGEIGTGESKMEISFNSEGTEVENIKMTSEIEITNDEMKDYVDVFKSSLESECSDTSTFKTCDVKVSGSKVTMSAEMIIPEDEKEQKIEDARQEIEEQGFICE